MASKTQKARTEFIERCEDIFGGADSWGNYKFTVGEGKTQWRVKLQRNAFRVEYKSLGDWRRMDGAFYTNPDALKILEKIRVRIKR